MIDQSYRILVAEDNQLNMELVCYMLENMQLPYAAAINGAEAVELFKKEKISAVLMDCHMPVMDGFQATSEIRRIESETSDGRRVPILALTANASMRDRKKCLEMDMDDYLSKPFKYQQLKSLLDKWLSRENPSADPSVETSESHKSPAVSDTAIVDLSSIEAVFKDPERVRKIIQKYIEQAGKYLQDMRLASEDENMPDLRFAAHALKSSSAYMGLSQVSQTCKELELFQKGKTTLTVYQLIARLEQELTAATPVLRDY